MRAFIIPLAFGVVLGACAQTNVQTGGSLLAGNLPRPAQVVVSDLDFAAEVVVLDKGFSARLQRRAGNLAPHVIREQLPRGSTRKSSTA